MSKEHGETITYGRTAGFTTKCVYDGTNPIYIGKARPGVLTSEAGWQIQKIDYDGDSITSISWAEGNDNFDKVWDDYLNYQYS